MLNFFRKSANSVVIKALMVVLALTFVLWGVGDVIRQSNKVIAFKVGDREYTDYEWQRAYAQQKSVLEEQVGKKFTAEEENLFGLRRAILNQLISKTLLLEEAKNLGLLVSDDMVRYEISSMPMFVKDGKFDKEVFERVIRNSGFSEQHFVEMLKEDIASQNLVTAQTINKEMPSVYLDNLLKAKGEIRSVKLYKINDSKLTIGVAKEEELKQIYDTNIDKFSTPEFRDINYFTFGIEDVKSIRTATEEELKEQYDSNVILYTEPEKRKVLQLVFKEESQATEAEKLLAAGKNFDEVARQFFPDKTSFVLGDNIVPTSFDKEISSAIFGIKANETSKPTKSPMGWHIFKVESIQPTKVKTFDEVKSQLKRQFEEELRFEALSKLGQEIDSEIDSGAKLSDIATKHGLKISTIHNWKSGEKSADLVTSNERFVSTAFGTDASTLSKVTPYKGNDKLFVLEVAKVIPKKPQAFSEVKDAVTKIWEEKTRAAFLAQRAKDAAAALNSNEKREDVISKFSLIEEDAQISLLKANEIKLPNELKEEIFKLEIGRYTIPVADSNNSFIIAKLEKTTPADTTKLEENRKVAELELVGTLGEEMMSQYLSYLRSKYKVAVYEDVIKL